MSHSVTRLGESVPRHATRPAQPSHAMPCHTTLPGSGYPAQATGRASHAMPCRATSHHVYPAEVTRHLSRSVTWLKRPATYLAMRPTMLPSSGSSGGRSYHNHSMPWHATCLHPVLNEPLGPAETNYTLFFFFFKFFFFFQFYNTT
jgi:hypothetical protein